MVLGVLEGCAGALPAGSPRPNRNSTIDLGTDPAGGAVRFSEIVNPATSPLSTCSSTGTTLWGRTDRADRDPSYVTANFAGNLGQTSFYGGIDNGCFLGTGYQPSGSGSSKNQAILVPERGAWVEAGELLAGAARMGKRRRCIMPASRGVLP